MIRERHSVGWTVSLSLPSILGRSQVAFVLFKKIHSLIRGLVHTRQELYHWDPSWASGLQAVCCCSERPPYNGASIPPWGSCIANSWALTPGLRSAHCRGGGRRHHMLPLPSPLLHDILGAPAISCLAFFCFSQAVLVSPGLGLCVYVWCVCAHVLSQSHKLPLCLCSQVIRANLTFHSVRNNWGWLFMGWSCGWVNRAHAKKAQGLEFHPSQDD